MCWPAWVGKKTRLELYPLRSKRRDNRIELHHNVCNRSLQRKIENSSCGRAEILTQCEQAELIDLPIGSGFIVGGHVVPAICVFVEGSFSTKNIRYSNLRSFTTHPIVLRDEVSSDKESTCRVSGDVNQPAVISLYFLSISGSKW
jgi:hypothetical protein